MASYVHPQVNEMREETSDESVEVTVGFTEEDSQEADRVLEEAETTIKKELPFDIYLIEVQKEDLDYLCENAAVQSVEVEDSLEMQEEGDNFFRK